MILATKWGRWTVIIHDFNEGFYWADVSGECPKPVMMLWMQTNMKTDNGLIHITMQKKGKRCKHIENALLFLERQIFIFESKDSACPRDKEVILIRQKDVRENQAVLRSKL